ncbi:hypothetical protein [Absidia glauca]|uniref:Uncharacterized protein n=1 Tax=Absidia glauca TaxID=4829 RepID=A0A163IXL5_ABSGL|nr:hypothetical protein [Absidia glauca]
MNSATVSPTSTQDTSLPDSWWGTMTEMEEYYNQMLTEHLASYQEHHYQERHHQYLKNKALKEYFIPTLVDLVHLRHEEPTNVREHLQYTVTYDALPTLTLSHIFYHIFNTV